MQQEVRQRMRNGFGRRWRMALLCIIFIFTYAAGLLPGRREARGAEVRYGYVKVDTSLNVRIGPGTVYERVRDQDGLEIYLLNGQNVTILGEAPAADGALWYQVEFTYKNNPYTGYCHSDYIVIVEGEDVDFEKKLEENGFPESYKVLLRELHKKYPAWEFIGFHTNLNWDYVIENETKIGDNLIPKDSIYMDGKMHPCLSSWKSLQYGAFNWMKNDWVILSPTYWVQASEEIVEYFMDPRNFLTEDHIFQFELLTFAESCHTEAGVELILKGTFMSNAVLDETSGLTYAQAFMQVGKELNVSPYHLASRVKQEKGTGERQPDGSYISKDPLISGTYPGYEGYYNYFNIEATGGNTYDQIVVNGLKEAKREGWDSRYKALYGGGHKRLPKDISHAIRIRSICRNSMWTTLTEIYSGGSICRICWPPIMRASAPKGRMRIWARCRMRFNSESRFMRICRSPVPCLLLTEIPIINCNPCLSTDLN